MTLQTFFNSNKRCTLRNSVQSSTCKINCTKVKIDCNKITQKSRGQNPDSGGLRLRLQTPGFNYCCMGAYCSLRPTLFMALHLSTCRIGCSTSLICRRDVEAGCARQPPVYSTSTRRGVSLSAIALLLLLAHDSGTVYLLTSSLPHHSRHFARN